MLAMNDMKRGRMLINLVLCLESIRLLIDVLNISIFNLLLEDISRNYCRLLSATEELLMPF